MNDHQPSAPGWKRWFRFRLRTLLIAVTLATIAFAWCRSQMLAAHRQRELAAAVEAAGGVVYYDWENHTPGEQPWTVEGLSFKSVSEQNLPPGPTWLREWIGDEYFQEIVEVDFEHRPYFHFGLIPTVGSDGNESADEGDDAKTIAQDDPMVVLDNYPEDRRLFDDVLQKVGRVPSVRYLYLGGGGYVDDTMLVPLKNLDQLEELDLSHQDITGEGLIPLSQLKNLRRLDLSETPFTDAGLYHLKQIENLEYVNLRKTKISGRRLGYLLELTRLRELDLSYLRLIKDEGDYRDWTRPAEVLGQMTQLRVLRLRHTKLDNYTFVTKLSNLEELDGSGTDMVRWEEDTRLGDLTKLKILRLAQTMVGADHLASFAKLQSLEELDVSATYVDDADCEILCQLKNLKRLCLERSTVSTIGVERLKSAFPQLDLYGYQGIDPATVHSVDVPIDDPNWISPMTPIF